MIIALCLRIFTDCGPESSGGEYAGLANLEKNEGGRQMVSLEPAGNGDNYSPSWNKLSHPNSSLRAKAFAILFCASRFKP